MDDRIFYTVVGAAIGAAAILFTRNRRLKREETIDIQEEEEGKQLSIDDLFKEEEHDILQREAYFRSLEQTIGSIEERVKLAEAAINKPPFEQYMQQYNSYYHPSSDEPNVTSFTDDGAYYDEYDGPGEYASNPDPHDRPYPITEDMIGEYGYAQIALYLLMPSKELVDEYFEPVENVGLWVSNNFLDYIDQDEGGGIIRNDILKSDFTIECLWRSADEVAMLRPNPPVELE